MNIYSIYKTVVGIFIVLTALSLQGCLETAKKKFEEGVNAYNSTVDKLTGGDSQQSQPQQTNTGTPALSAPPSQHQVSANQSENAILTRKENWLKRDPFYQNLPFDGGEYKVIKAPSNKYIDLYIPMHKGLPRVGLTPTFGLNKANPNTVRNVPHRDLKAAFTARLERDMNTYIVLKYMAMKKNLFTPERLKVDKSSQPVNRLRLLNDVFHIGDYAPRFHVEHMVSTLISPELWEKYMCSNPTDCDKLKYAMPRGGSGWGGGLTANEFSAQKAFNGFMDNEVNGMLEWGNKLSDTMYLVWQASMGDYDFEKKQYRVSFIAHNADMTYATTTFKPAMFKTISAAYETYMPIDPSGAEVLEKKLKGELGPAASKTLYAVMKVKLKGFKSKKADHARPVNQDFIVDFVGDKIMFYSDENLTDKVFETNQFK